MHALEVIIHRNTQAAGREAAHAANEGQTTRVYEIEQAERETRKGAESALSLPFALAYLNTREWSR